ncbi:hypothetical protein [Draconibacterium sp.]|uniref:hypothetical protein n=1 Tax=Draconibacterium sp. TaxID=1965318 RepID=UPI0035636E9D
METLAKYLPVSPDFYDVMELLLHRDVRVIYFGVDQILEESNGSFKGIDKKDHGEFMEIVNDKNVRLDRIITINGKIGPAYDAYEAYANACLSCQAGYDD